MNTDTLAIRIARYLQRHIVYYRETLAALAAADLDDPAVADEFTARAHAGAALDAEQAALLRAWSGGRDSSEVERAAVRALAAEAGALAEELREAYGQAEVRVAASAALLREQADTVRRSAEAARRFAPGQGDSGGYLDHSA